jgi:hypothetical protein
MCMNIDLNSILSSEVLISFSILVLARSETEISSILLLCSSFYGRDRSVKSEAYNQVIVNNLDREKDLLILEFVKLNRMPEKNYSISKNFYSIFDEVLFESRFRHHFFFLFSIYFISFYTSLVKNLCSRPLSFDYR